MASGKAPRQKGDRGERELVGILLEHGKQARRVPLSGSVATFPGDVLVGPEGDEEIWEAKRRRQGFKQLHKWLQDARVVAVRVDHGDWFVCLRLTDYLSDSSPEHGAPVRGD